MIFSFWGPFSSPRPRFIFFQLAAFIGIIRTGFGVCPLAVLACRVLPLCCKLGLQQAGFLFPRFKGMIFFLFRCFLGPLPCAVPVAWRPLP